MQDKPWGKAFAAMKRTEYIPLPLLQRENGTQCQTSAESVKELLTSKFPEQLDT